MEHLLSIVGFLPYDCRGCHNRFLRSRHSPIEAVASANPGVEREIAATRRANGWKRTQREVLLYGLALAVFVAILYFLIRAPSNGA
jgi:hypothetical protein